MALYVIPNQWGRLKLWMLYSVMDDVQCNPVGTIPSVTDQQTFPARVRSRLLVVLCRRI